MLQSPHPVLIAGGGIGGLTLALALAELRIPSRILERRDKFSAAGAGIQLGPNATRILTALGVTNELQPSVGVPEQIVVMDGATGRVLQRLPLGNWLADRHGAPYWVAHRADLLAALLNAAARHDCIDTTTGFEVTAIEQISGGVRVADPSGRCAEGACLIGADGVWSSVRRWIAPGASLRSIGKIAARTVLPRRDGEGCLSEHVVGVWLFPGTHVVHYPVRGGRDVAAVVVLSSDERWEGWGRTADAADILTAISGLSIDLRQGLQRADHWQTWSLCEADALPSWSNGRVTLLGDAAHPILPFLAQGGAMAIEDAALLSRLLARDPAEPAGAFMRYQQLRAPRVHHVQSAARRNGRIYDFPAPLSMARNLAMAALGGQAIMRTYDWIYGWRVESINTA